jgi:hypothetical protein
MTRLILSGCEAERVGPSVSQKMSARPATGIPNSPSIEHSNVINAYARKLLSILSAMLKCISLGS